MDKSISHILESNIPHVHCGIILHQAGVNVKDLWESTASGSKQDMPLIHERAIMQRPLIKGPVYVVSGPAGVWLYPTLSSQACAQSEYRDSGS